MPGYLDYLSDKYPTENFKAINQKMLELSSLFEISQILNSSLDLNHVLNNILLIPMGRLMISKGVIFLKTENRFIPRLWKGFPNSIQDLSFQAKELPVDLKKAELVKLSPEKLRKFSDFLKDVNLCSITPIIARDNMIGFICYGSKITRQPFTAEEQEFLTSLSNLSATAIENALKVDEIKYINKILDGRIQQLKTLFDITQGLSATLESEKIIKLLTYALMGQMLVYHYVIVLQNETGLQKIDCKGFSQDMVEGLLAGTSGMGNFTAAVLTESVPNTANQEKLLKIGAKVVIPMRHQNKSLGFILLGEKINKQTYTENDLEFLTTLVSQAVISLENARLFRETLEKQRIEQELQVAKTIQRKLLPREIISMEGYDTWGLNTSSKEVGGDYFDLIQISENRFALAIADVSGKSIPAALIMANLQAGLRTIITENINLDQVVGKLNNLIFRNTDLDKYVTFFVGVLDCRTHHFSYVNAGHNPPLFLRNDQRFQPLEEGGIILGMIPDYPYKMGSVQFNPGDLLVTYTDGVSEALNAGDEEFGEKRLQDLIIEHQAYRSRQLAESIVAAISRFAGETPQYDDITLLITRRLL